MRIRSLIPIVLGILALAVPMASQSPAGIKPSFEVASIKRSTAERPRNAVEPGGRYVATGVTLRLIMTSAYRGQSLQFSGTPGWVESDLWDIEAKAPEGSVPPRTGMPDLSAPDTIALMVQSLLEERFLLKMHRETRELPVYELTIAKGGGENKVVGRPNSAYTSRAGSDSASAGRRHTKGRYEDGKRRSRSYRDIFFEFGSDAFRTIGTPGD